MREEVGLGHRQQLTGAVILRGLGGWFQVLARRRSGKRKRWMSGYRMESRIAHLA
jgi:hypothetical protein